jgi:hypothetical protein
MGAGSRMSYDLYFWRQAKHFEQGPDEILDLFAEDQPVDGIVAFERGQVRQLLRETFPDIQDDDFELTWEGSGSYFQISFGHASERIVQVISVSCGFSLLKSPEVINRLIDTLGKLGCAMYDPQTGERYEQPKPKTRL